jgi:hypothetical protein
VIHGSKFPIVANGTTTEKRKIPVEVLTVQLFSTYVTRKEFNETANETGKDDKHSPHLPETLLNVTAGVIYYEYFSKVSKIGNCLP